MRRFGILKLMVLLTFIVLSMLTGSEQKRSVWDIGEVKSSPSVSVGPQESTGAEMLPGFFTKSSITEIISRSTAAGAQLQGGVLPYRMSVGMREELAGRGIQEFMVPVSRDKSYDFGHIDRHALNAPSREKTGIDEMVEYLVSPCKNELEKARAIFTWIAYNVNYDDHNYNLGKFGDNSAPGVYNSGIGVCQGYADLFDGMAFLAGLESHMVIGYSKGIEYRIGEHLKFPDHAWNAVKLEGKWILLDATWASGYGTVENGQLKSVKHFDDFWFDTDPAEFLFSHYPQDPWWQLREEKINLRQYESMPGADASFFKLGFDGESCLDDALKGEIEAFPTAYINEGSVQAVSLPNSSTLEAGQRIMLILESEKANKMVLFNNGKYYFLNKDSNEFGGVIKPSAGKLTVNINYDGSNNYNTLIAYEVK